MRVLPPADRIAAVWHAGDAPTNAAAVLGAGHPLVDVVAKLRTCTEQLLAIAIVHLLAVSLWAWRAGPAVALVAGAIASELAFGLRIFLLRQSRRDLCLDLIVAGREALPVPAIAAERRRLSTPGYASQLARCLRQLVSPPSAGAILLTARPPISARMVDELAPELRELDRRLRDEQVSCRAIALVEQLISSPFSPLYGTDSDALRRELGRVRFLS